MPKKIKVISNPQYKPEDQGWHDKIIVYSNENETEVLWSGIGSCVPAPYDYMAHDSERPREDTEEGWAPYKDDCGWLATGSYSWEVEYWGLFGSNCLKLNGGGACRTRRYVPKNGGYFSTQVWVHPGGRATDPHRYRGSIGCITIPDDWWAFIGCFGDNESGVLEVTGAATEKIKTMIAKNSEGIGIGSMSAVFGNDSAFASSAFTADGSSAVSAWGGDSGGSTDQLLAKYETLAEGHLKDILLGSESSSQAFESIWKQVIEDGKRMLLEKLFKDGLPGTLGGGLAGIFDSLFSGSSGGGLFDGILRGLSPRVNVSVPLSINGLDAKRLGVDMRSAIEDVALDLLRREIRR